MFNIGLFPVLRNSMYVFAIAFLSCVCTAAAQAVILPGTYQIVPASSATNCVDVQGPSTNPGAAVQLYTCGDPTYAKNQVWQVTPIQTPSGSAAYQLISAYSNLCLDVDGVSTANGAHLQQYTCGSNQSLNQLWTFGLFSGGYQVVSVNSAACLDLPGGSTTPGNLLQQWSCGGGQNPNQLWKLVPVGATASPPPGMSANLFGLTVLNTATTSTPLTFAGTRSMDTYPEVNWRDLEPTKGAFTFANLDAFMAANASRGTSMLYVFNAIPDWASKTPSGTTANGTGYCGEPANLADWDAFVTAIATHVAGKIHLWEVWNEPQYYYCGTMATLVTMAQHASKILKSIDPSAQLLSPAGTTSGGPAMLSSFLAGGGGSYVDVIACHGYHTGQDEQIVPTLQNYKDVMTQYSISSMPLWDTESSWNGVNSNVTPAGRAAYVAKSYLLHASMGLQRFYWYAYDSTLSWGGLTVSGVSAPEVSAYHEVNRWMVGATLATDCAAGSGGTWTCSLTRPAGYQGIVVWNSSATVTYTVPAGFTQYRLIDGTLQSVAAGSTVSVGNQPVLFETQTGF